VAADNRLLTHAANGSESTAADAVARAGVLLGAGGVAVVGSGRSTVEEQFLTRKLAEAVAAPTWLVGRVGQGDGLLVSADRNPNVRGALVTGLISAVPSENLARLVAQIDAGKIKTVVSIGEDLTIAGLGEAQLSKVSVIYVGTHANATSTAASVVIPALTVFEKAGTFINQQFRLQKFAPAVPGPQGVADDLVTLSELIRVAGGPQFASSLNGLWETLAAEVRPLATASYQNLPSTGLLVDAGDLAALPFPEGPSLHFKPKQ